MYTDIFQLQKKEIQSLMMTWMDLIITLSKINQTKTNAI